MSLEGNEGHLLFSPNEISLDDVPKENADLEQKSHAKRLRSVLYILYRQSSEKGEYIGTFENYYNEQMEKIITRLKDKIHED